MAIKTRLDKRTGKTHLVIDLVFRHRTTRAQERYRRDSRVQTKAAAEKEERFVIGHFVEHGTIEGLLRPEPTKEETVVPVEVKTWGDAAERFETVVCPGLKPSTRHGYKKLLAGEHFEAWQSLALTGITSGVIAEWDGMITSTDVGESTRRNHHVVLRSVLRCALAAGWISALPGLPKLPKVGRTVVQAVQPADVHAILYETDEGVGDLYRGSRVAARRALALMALAGLRSSEVRGLRWRDVDFIRGVLTVRQAVCGGEADTPKSGNEREIPITKALAAFLGERPEGRDVADQLVAPKADGTPWADPTIGRALQRACRRLGIDHQRAHALRHGFVTSLFDAGIGAHTVQALAGHGSLDVTQRYAHTNHAAKVAAVAMLDKALSSMANVVRLPKKAKAVSTARRAKASA